MIKEDRVVAINAQLMPNRGHGGIEMVLIALIKALGELDGPESYKIITPWQNPFWLAPYLSSNQKIIPAPDKGILHQLTENLKSQFSVITPIIRKFKYKYMATKAIFSNKEGFAEKNIFPSSNGFFENLGVGVIHFPYQEYIKTNIPSIFNPHDLQHVHFPEFFTKEELIVRANTYKASCQFATTVIAASNWMKEDFKSQLDVPHEKNPSNTMGFSNFRICRT